MDHKKNTIFYYYLSFLIFISIILLFIIIDSKLHLSVILKIPTGGAQVWQFDGNDWNQINFDGFGDEFNIGIREMILFNNKLIACTMNINTGCEVWQLE